MWFQLGFGSLQETLMVMFFFLKYGAKYEYPFYTRSS